MFHKLLVFGAGALAVIFGFGALSIFRSGGGGGSSLLGLFFALGCAVMGFLALRLPHAGPGLLKRSAHRYVPTPIERRGFLAAAGITLSFTAYSLIAGEVPSKRRHLERKKNPSNYWKAILFFAGVGGVALFYGLRQLPQDPPPRHRQRPQRPVRRDPPGSG